MSDDQQTTPPPLDLDAIEKRVADLTGVGMLLRAEQRVLREDVPALVAECRRLRAENVELRHQAVLREVVRMDAAQDVSELEVSNGRLRAELAAARAALERIRDEAHGMQGPGGAWEIARAALADRPASGPTYPSEKPRREE